jgi:hypothetical protein
MLLQSLDGFMSQIAIVLQFNNTETRSENRPGEGISVHLSMRLEHLGGVGNCHPWAEGYTAMCVTRVRSK